MESFKLFLESRKWNLNIPVLRGLAAEAMKCSSFDDFSRDFSLQIKHGLYYHWTDDPNFTIDPNKGPRDMSSLAAGSVDKGKLMITSHLRGWSDYGNRKYVALIDMTDVPRNSYYQVNRGFGNEFWVADPSKAKVIKVMPRYLPHSEDELLDFYNFVKGQHSDAI